MEKEVFDRLIVEFNELNEKTTKCREFLLDEEKVKELDFLNRDLLISQLKTMETYLSLLSIRIGLNAPKEQVVESVNNEDSEPTTDAEVVNE